jgi:succinate dehydrogenase / fumarate reductase cytochrome b subunit
MSWVSTFFGSTLGRKVIVAATGLFLCLFLVIHLLGNLQLIWGSQEGFNEYTEFMTHNKLIKVASYLTYASILAHALLALGLGQSNRKARPVDYAVSGGSKNSSWSSRNMIVLGVVLFVYIVVHLQNFWYQLKFGSVPSDPHGLPDMWTVVYTAFKVEWLVGLYVVAMLALAYHLVHGFQSGFQTVGVTHNKYTPIIKNLGTWVFGLLLPLAYAAIPVYVYLTA